MADGKVIIETGLDSTGAANDLKSIGSMLKKAGKGIGSIKAKIETYIDEKSKTKTKTEVVSLVDEVNNILQNAKTDININVSDEDLNIVSSRVDKILSNTELVTSEKVKKINAEFQKIGLTGVSMDTTTTATDKATQSTKKLDKEAKNLNKDLKSVGSTGAKSMKQLSKEADNTSKSLLTLKSALGKIIGILGVGFSIGALVNMGKEAVNLASDLMEVQNVVDTAFGEMSYKMEEFADTAIETYGISKLTAKNIGSTYTAMARGMGQSLDEATDSALEMTGRVADIASFYNLAIDRANTIGRAVYSGETEPLKQIGVIMTQDQLAAFALANGYSKLYKNMSAAEQLEVRQAYFLSQTSLAAGDFVKTQDSWANQTRILSERWKEFLSVLGSGLIQILTPALKFLNQVVSAMTAALTAFNKFLGIETKVSSTGASGIADISTGMDDVTSSTEKASKAQEKLLGSYDKLSVISPQDSGSSGGGPSNGGGGGGLDISEAVDNTKTEAMNTQLEKMKSLLDAFKTYVATNFGEALSNIGAGIQTNLTNTKLIFSGILEDIKALIPPFISYLNTDFPAMLNTALITAGDVLNGTWDSINLVISSAWDTFIYPILQKFITTGLPVITQFVTQVIATFDTLFITAKGLFDTLWKEGIEPFLDTLSTVVTDLMDIIAQVWAEYGEPIFEGIRKAITNVGNTLYLIWESILRPIWDTIKAALDELWAEHLKPLVLNIAEFVAELAELALNVYNNFISPIINWFIAEFGPAISTTISHIVSIIQAILGPIISVVSGVITILRGIITFLNGVFTGNWKRAWEGVKLIFKGIWDSFVNIIKVPVNLIIGVINTLLLAIQSGVNACIRIINGLSFDVPDWVPKLGGKKFGFNLSSVTIGRIPYLASGAVIPPNKEFMAVLGDQTSGTNIETPLKTMIEAFNTALDSRGGANHEPIILQLPNGKVIAEIVWSEEEKRYKQTGTYRPRYS